MVCPSAAATGVRPASWSSSRRFRSSAFAHEHAPVFLRHCQDSTKILYDRERFSHELRLVFASGKTQVLTHEKKEPE
jgi:hypothetical protein